MRNGEISYVQLTLLPYRAFFLQHPVSDGKKYPADLPCIVRAYPDAAHAGDAGMLVYLRRIVLVYCANGTF